MQHEFYGGSGAAMLRPLRENDIEYIRILRNRYRECFLFSDEISVDAQKQWYITYQKKTGDYMFAVYFGERRVGAVAIYGVDEDTQTGEFGRLMLEKQVPSVKGLGVDTTRAACRIAFEQLRLFQLKLKVYCDNVIAQITYLKAGFCPTDILVERDGKKVLQMECKSTLQL